MMLVCLIGPLSSPVTADEAVDNFPDGDAWIKLELKSWEGNESEEWDNDESAPDPQFRVCVDADGDNVDCFNSPTWDNQWNLSHVWRGVRHPTCDSLES